MSGSADKELLRLAESQYRVVVTYGSDFGASVIRGGEAVYGILFIRPVDVKLGQVIEIVDTIVDLETEVEPPLIITVKRAGTDISVRVRTVESKPDNGSEGMKSDES